MFIFLIPLSLAAIIAVCTIISRSAATAKAEQAAARAASIAAAAAEEKARATAERKAEREKAAAARHAVKLARANELREAAEKRLAAERALKSRKSDAPDPVHDPEQPAPHDVSASGKAFAGQVVAFTGTIPGVKRADAIAEVKRQGGRAYNGDMGTDVTMIIVGNVRNETEKLKKAKAWGIKQVPASEWLRLCNA